MRILTYADDVKALEKPGNATDIHSIFLAGPTTDADPSGIGHFHSCIPMSSWRAEAATTLYDLGFRGTVIVPEFVDRAVPFHEKAAVRFGNTKVPRNVWARPAAWGLLSWEEDMMKACSLVMAWADVRSEQPGLGLNARPEIYGLLLRHAVGSWPVRLAVGVPETATGVTRMHREAHNAALPVHRTLPELARAALSKLGLL